MRRALNLDPSLPDLVSVPASMAGESAVAAVGGGKALRFGMAAQESCALVSWGLELSVIGDTGDSGSAVEWWMCFSGEVESIAPTIHHGVEQGEDRVEVGR